MRFPDSQTMALNFAASKVKVPVVSAVPRERPEAFIRIWRNGGPSKNRVIDRPLITCEGWALDSVVAGDLTETVRSAFLHDWGEMPLVRRVTEISGLYWIPDPESGTPRWRFSVQLTVRAQR